MRDHALRVGEQLVIQGHARLTILAVEDNEVILDPGSGNGLPRDEQICYSPQTSQGEGRQGGLPWQARRRRW